MRRREAVPTPADNNHVIGPLRLRIAPQEIGVLRQVSTGPNRATVHCGHRTTSAIREYEGKLRRELGHDLLAQSGERLNQINLGPPARPPFDTASARLPSGV
jgi:hypothetical protein